MSNKIRHKISLDRVTARPKSKYHKPVQEGYGQFNNADFIFSDDITRWMHGKAKPTRNAKPLF